MNKKDSSHSLTKQDSDYLQLLDTKMELSHNTSDQNGFYTYMCQLNEIKPTDIEKIMVRCFSRPSQELIDEVMEDEPRHIERMQASHEHIESKNDDSLKETDASTAYPSSTTDENSDCSETDDLSDEINKPSILRLTKMKWLSENQSGSIDSRSPCLSPNQSLTGSYVVSDSEENIGSCISLGEKCLSTILRLDKEHNMFGLSNITIVNSKFSRTSRKKDEGPVFPQTAIIQICCGRGCCKHKSNTDLPSSLKCGRYICADPYCSMCSNFCGNPCYSSSICTKESSQCKSLCSPSKCLVDCNTGLGLKIVLKRKPKYEPLPIEITPRSSCVLQKPQAARSCHHSPRCHPPSSCFPYLMPCYWPPRASAPCNTPARCFHNPPCLPPRRRQAPIPSEYLCPTDKKCIDGNKKTKCPNPSCPGNNPTMKKEIENRFGNKK
ncbi:unnamed protein product [Parnassius mnemosyne]|uniref:Uncharacterized protein n=1 Tax=Parnassius mnemosyne TaxID=213953 RepID=A0AAV1KM54_9NEOP